MKTAAPMFLALCFTAQAATVTLAWDPSPDDVSRYRLVVTNETGVSELWATNATQLDVTGLSVPSTNYAVVYAVDAEGVQSSPSNLLRFVIPRPPSNLRVKTVLQSAVSPEGPWRDYAGLAEIPIPDDEPTGFYRVVLDMQRE